MKNLAVKILRCVDEMSFPGWLEAELVDAEGRRHIFIDKVPAFTANFLLDSKSTYPQAGTLPCEVRESQRDSAGREVFRVAIYPGVESKEGLTEFVVFAAQVSETHD